MKISPRSQKLAGLVQEHLPGIIPLFLTPDDIGFLTVSAIEISGDLKVADVFVSHLSPSEIEQSGKNGCIKKLNQKARVIEAELQKRLEMRQTLKLRFKIDQSVAHVEKMQKIMEKF